MGQKHHYQQYVLRASFTEVEAGSSREAAGLGPSYSIG